MSIQWYPGHMARAERKIKENLSLVDLVIELRDARVPQATANPRLKQIASQKPRLIVLNKADLAEGEVTAAWLSRLAARQQAAISIDSIAGNARPVLERVKQLAVTVQEQRARKGMRPRAVRTMVVGVPNVGKSSFINRLSRRAPMKTGAKPGVTRGQQWYKLGGDIELLDTPGVLWPKFDSEQTGLKLAWIGCIGDHVFDVLEALLALIRWLAANKPESLINRYGLTASLGEPLEVLKVIGTKRGCLMPGGKIDYEKAAELVLREFREGKLGRFSLEQPDFVGGEDDSK